MLELFAILNLTTSHLNYKISCDLGQGKVISSLSLNLTCFIQNISDPVHGQGKFFFKQGRISDGMLLCDSESTQQVMGMDKSLFPRFNNSYNFKQKYIFSNFKWSNLSDVNKTILDEGDGNYACYIGASSTKLVYNIDFIGLKTRAYIFSLYSNNKAHYYDKELIISCEMVSEKGREDAIYISGPNSGKIKYKYNDRYYSSLAIPVSEGALPTQLNYCIFFYNGMIFISHINHLDQVHFVPHIEFFTSNSSESGKYEVKSYISCTLNTTFGPPKDAYWILYEHKDMARNTYRTPLIEIQPHTYEITTSFSIVTVKE